MEYKRYQRNKKDSLEITVLKKYYNARKLIEKLLLKNKTSIQIDEFIARTEEKLWTLESDLKFLAIIPYEVNAGTLPDKLIRRKIRDAEISTETEEV